MDVPTLPANDYIAVFHAYEEQVFEDGDMLGRDAEQLGQIEGVYGEANGDDVCVQGRRAG